MKSKKTEPAKKTGSKQEIESNQAFALRKEIYSTGRIDKEYPLIIWRKPGVDQKHFEAALKTFQSKSGISDDAVFYCEDCDKGLLKLGGRKSMNIVLSGKTGGGASATATQTTLQALENSAHWGANIICKFPVNRLKKKPGNDKSSKKDSGYKDKAIAAAIFDSGLDRDILPLGDASLAGISSPCKTGGNKGWNFVDNKQDTKDDYSERHGTVVTDFIVEQEIKAQKKVQVVPVKTHNKDGGGNIFDILCGIAYAAKGGAKVINASFGYYSDGTDECTTLFRQYLEFYLVKNNILMICAAGNKDANADKAFLERFAEPDRPNHDPRNLDENRFYPACFSTDFPRNVITVTTVSRINNDVSPVQNYSPNYVDIGVYCDNDAAGKACEYSFNSLLTTRPVIGSSFATPIVTGKICSHYDNGTLLNKANIIREMCKPNRQLEGKIKKGKVLI